MTIEEIKQTIEQHTGVPASLLTGETAEENIAQAKALIAYKRELIAYKREYEQQRPKTTAEQFSDWIGGQLENTDGQTKKADNLPDPRPARRQFADWFSDWQKTEFDPFKDTDSWQRIL